jgi:phosphatidylserine/phosphatidylglycerophosphate/cardiolipin synthase-like enzyme
MSENLPKRIIAVLQQNPSLRIEEVSARLSRNYGINVKLSELIDALIALEKEEVVRKIRDEEFDPYKPLTTIKWQLTRPEILPVETLQPPLEEAWIVTSRPIYSPLWASLDKILKESKTLTTEEAVHKLILDSENTLRVACPYYDEIFASILYKAADRVSRLSEVRILYEEENPVLFKIKGLLSNISVKSLIRREPVKGLKYVGMHAKLLIADDKEALLGSFNLRAQNIYYNFEVGLLLKGELARKLKDLYDAVWDSV